MPDSPDALFDILDLQKTQRLVDVPGIKNPNLLEIVDFLEEQDFDPKKSQI